MVHKAIQRLDEDLQNGSEKDRTLILKKLKEFTKDSILTEEDALRLGKKVSRALSDRLRKKVE